MRLRCATDGPGPGPGHPDTTPADTEIKLPELLSTQLHENIAFVCLGRCPGDLVLMTFWWVLLAAML